MTTNPDAAGNPLHLLLIGFAVVLGLAVGRLRTRTSFGYLLCVASGFLLFCLMLKWQVWGSRLQLPLFVLWAPFVGHVLALMQPRWAAALFPVVLVAASSWWLLYNKSGPLLGAKSIFRVHRHVQYFRHRPAAASLFAETASFLSERGYARVGLAVEGDQWTYPFWTLLKNNVHYNVHFKHVDVSNVSGKIKQADFKPQAVVCQRQDRALLTKYVRQFGRPKEFGRILVFGR